MADKLFAKLPGSRWPEKLDVLFAAKLSLRFLDCMQYKSPVRLVENNCVVYTTG